MIYVSTSCVKNNLISQSVKDLAEEGFQNIELSGGTERYDGFIDDLLEMKQQFNLNYRCHNYFPPPKKHFVLNIASLDSKIFDQSIQHLLEAINLSKTLGASKFAFHAGFYIHIDVNEIGKKINHKKVHDINLAKDQFCKGFEILKSEAGNLNLYVENNVFSKTNFETFKGQNLFMLTSFQDYLEIKKRINFNLLLDIAHLKVSSNTLSLDFPTQLKQMLDYSDYIHVSDNDSLHDLNQTLTNDSHLFSLLQQYSFKGKDFTIEVYDSLDEIKKTYQTLEGLS